MRKLQPQLANATRIRQVLQEVDISCTWDNETVNVRLIYLPCRDGVCDVLSLFDVIKSSLMANFVFSHKTIQRKLEIQQNVSDDELFNKAINFISKKTAHGELGELLLFTLLDVYMEAPKILSKVCMKTSRRVPVFGADAVHAQYAGTELLLYLGESKLYTSFKSASKKAVTSISESLKNYDHEFSLIETHIDFPNIDDATAQEVVNLLNPFNDKTNKEHVHFPCFIGFAEPTCFYDEKTYISHYTDIACEYIGNYFSELEKIGIHRAKTTLLMLPFSSIKDTVEKFIDYMGIKR